MSGKTFHLRKMFQRVCFRDVIVAAVIGVLLSLARAGELLHTWQISSTDFLHGDVYAGEDIVIVAIDDESIAQLGAWPWSHAIHAQLIEALSQARVIGIDILYEDVSDPSLIEETRQANNLVLPLLAVLSDQASLGVIPAQTLVTPPSDLISVAVGWGTANVIPDADGVIRRVPLLFRQDDFQIEAMGLQVIRQYLGLPNSATGELEGGHVRAGPLLIPVDEWGSMAINYIGGPGSFPTVSSADVLAGIIPPDTFSDKIVLVGQIGITSGGDVHSVPTSNNGEWMDGVEIQANIIHTILHHRFLEEQPLANDIAIILGMALLSGLILPQLRMSWGLLAASLVGGGHCLYTFFSFNHGMLLDLLYPMLSLGLSYIAAIGVDNIGLYKDLQQKNIELVQTYDTTLEGWARALELRDYETKGHSTRVTDLTVRLALAIGVDKEELVHIRRGAVLHDIGKMGIPDNVLLKPGELDEDDWQIMRQHPRYGYDMLVQIDFLEPALDIVLYHHERWDGTGYPQGLQGEEIPLAARIFAVVDVWDALINDRPYRKAWTKDEARVMIKELCGKHFDPQVASTFLKLVDTWNMDLFENSSGFQDWSTKMRDWRLIEPDASMAR